MLKAFKTRRDKQTQLSVITTQHNTTQDNTNFETITITIASNRNHPVPRPRPRPSSTLGHTQQQDDEEIVKFNKSEN